jgi:uncharacterized membrane protein YqjE
MRIPMRMPESGPAQAPPGGGSRASVSAGVRRLGASFLALGRIRLELLAIEVQEEKERAVSMLFWAVLSALVGGFGLVFGALLLTVALWDSHRMLALGLSSGLFIVLAAYGLWRIRHLSGGGATLFSASLAELAADERVLRGSGPAGDTRPGAP